MPETKTTGSQRGRAWAGNLRARTLAMVALVLGGEMIFGLPFHVPRYFRPTLLEVFGLSYSDFGDIFAAYGIAALISYFPGGAIADRYSARRLMSLSLLATAAGGLYLLTFPGRLGLSVLYAYWGVTTILLFWSALIGATREWGGSLAQGRGFGLLDAGRGLAAGLVATAGVFLLRAGLEEGLPGGVASARVSAFRQVILMYSGATAVAGLAALKWVPDPSPGRSAPRGRAWSEMRAVMRVPAVWHQAVVLVCAYCAYKALDHYSVYGVDVLGMPEADAAAFATLTVWARPIAALASGTFGDKVGIALATALLFAASVVGWGALSVLEGVSSAQLYSFVALTCLAAYGFRGLYFALLEHARIPRRMTGAAVGLISLAGFSPDVFFGAVTGRLLDATPGIGGYRRVFLLVVGASALGLASSGWLHRRFGGKALAAASSSRIDHSA